MVCPVFEPETEVIYYNKLLRNPEYYVKKEGVLAFIAYMEPMEFLRICWLIQMPDESFNDYLKRVLRKELVEKYLSRMKAGEKFPIPFLDFRKWEQEGRHRAYCAMLYGCKLIPVAIIVEKCFI